MKILNVFLIFIFLLSCTTTEQEIKNPFERTTWELTSGKWVREDTTLSFPDSPYDQDIMIFGKTHFSIVGQDTSRKTSYVESGKYSIEGDNFNFAIEMHFDYDEIGKSNVYKFETEGDQLIFKRKGYRYGGYNYKEGYEVWSRMTSAQEKKNPLEGTTWEMGSAEYTWGDSIMINPTSNFHKGLSISGKTYTLGTWQDTSKQNTFYVGHRYTIEDDTVIFKIIFWPDSRYIGRTIKLKYEMIENELILNGVIPTKKWGLQENDMKLHEVWKRID
jgi:hypothetical protein